MKLLDPGLQTTIPLHFSIANSLLSNVRFLIESGDDANARDDRGRTPLMICCLNNNEQLALGVARMLLQAGGSVGVLDDCKRNALMYGILFKRTSIVLLMLQALDYAINQSDIDGNNVLHYLALSGNLKILNNIIEIYQKQNLPLDSTNKQKQSPLEIALRMGYMDCANTLIQNGSKIVQLKKKSSIGITYENPSIIHRKAIQSVLESCRVHKASSELNVHQFRREVMTKYHKRKNSDDFSQQKNSVKTMPRRGSYPLVNKKVAQIKKQPKSLENGSDDEKIACVNKNLSKKKPAVCKSWKEELPKVWDVYKDQVSPSFRKAAVQKQQTNEEGLKLLSLYTENTTEEENSEDDNFLKPSAAALSKRRNTTANIRHMLPNRLRTKSAGNVEMLRAINDPLKRHHLLSDDQSSVNSGSSERRRKKKNQNSNNLDVLSDSSSTSSSSSFQKLKKQQSKKCDSETNSKQSKIRPGSAVRNPGKKLPPITENGTKEMDENKSNNVATIEGNLMSDKIPEKIKASPVVQSTFSSADKVEPENASTATSPQLEISLADRREELKRKQNADKVLSDISEEGSISSDHQIIVKKIPNSLIKSTQRKSYSPNGTLRKKSKVLTH